MGAKKVYNGITNISIKRLKMTDRTSGEKNRTIKGALYLVGTPIGNLTDISERAIKVLSESDFIAAEDTRNSLRLLTHFGIQKPLISYFEHNKAQRGAEIVERLLNGETCALVTDAGMPAISDPGEDLVRLCIEKGVLVTTVPGPCAAITALTLSGFSTLKFTFEGFLSASKSERRAALAELSDERRTMIFHEAPHKLKATLSDMASAFGGDRRIALCRELTKLNEQIIRLSLDEAIEYYKENDPRGEFVLVVEGSKKTGARSLFWENLSVRDHVLHYVNGGMSKNDAIKAAAKDRGLPKNSIYQEVLDLKA